MNFSELFRKKFEFLEKEFMFRIVRDYPDQNRIEYENETTVIAAALDSRDYIFTIDVGRKDKKIIEGLGDWRYDLSDIIEFKNKDFYTEMSLLSGMDYNAIMDKYAIYIKKHAGDLLRGDFADFHLAQKAVNKRTHDYDKWLKNDPTGQP